MSKSPWALPASWSWEQIGEVCEVVGGGTPPTGEASNFDGGDIPWVTPADLSGYREKLITRGERNITRAGLESSAAKLLPKGAVLFSSRAPVGYVAIADNPLTTNQGFKSFVSPSGILSDYLYYYLQRAKPLALELASGTTFLEVSAKRAAQIPFAIAPTKEQQRIVEKVEELFPDLDAGVAALERARANLKRYRAAVLKAAVEGRLTEQWRKEHPDVEPASKLLERILVERRRKWEEGQLARFAAAGKEAPKGWKDKYVEPAKPDTPDLPELPQRWCWAGLEQVSSAVRVICYGILMPKENIGTGVPYVRVKDLKGDRIDLDALHRTTPEIAAQYARASLQPGDVLLAIRGTYGRVAEVPQELMGGNITQDTARIEVSSLISPTYVAWTLRSDDCQMFFKRVARGVAVRGVNIGDVRLTPIPLAPADEQREVVAEIARRLSIIEGIDNQTATGGARASRLRQSILKRAFEGKLVPQDPNDEPASVLLERIRQVRAAESTQRVPKRRRSPA